MATRHSTPALQTSHTRTTKNRPFPTVPQAVPRPARSKTLKIKIDPETLECLEFFGRHSDTRHDAHVDGIHYAIAWTVLAYLNSREPSKMAFEMMSVHAGLRDKFKELQGCREAAELTKLYNLPDTEKETLAS